MFFKIFVVVLIWGANFVVIKAGVQELGPFTLGAIRFFLASIPFLYFYKFPKIPVRYVVLFSMFFGFGQFSLLFLAIERGFPSGLASLVIQSQAIISPLLAFLFLSEKISRNSVIGIFIAMTGLMVLSSQQENVDAISNLLMVVGAAFNWAASNIVVKYLNRKSIQYNPVSLIVWSSLLLPVPFYLMSILTDEPSLGNIQNIYKVFFSCLYLGIVATIIAYRLWIDCINRHGVSNVAPFSLLIPVLGLGFGYIFYSEKINTIEILGMLVILTGILMHMFSIKRLILKA